ncbi:ankyrin repeat-containing domain protein [Mycena rebaudengoi]|nr:ankyrin repeat-containing domain protein [Mycena rebaudengoi]
MSRRPRMSPGLASFPEDKGSAMQAVLVDGWAPPEPSLSQSLPPPPEPSMGSHIDPGCIIPSDPDISGIGVRVAIYAQNLLSFVPVAGVLWDGYVSPFELESLQGQSTTILITAFAILISAMVEVRTIGLSSFHANIILDLSWMNNTNTFIYFLLYVQHQSQEGRDQVRMGWIHWIKHFRDELRRTFSWNSQKRQLRGPDESDTAPLHSSLFTKIVLVLGSIHLSLMAALGIWLRSAPGSFGNPTPCASTVILGDRVGLESRGLRRISLLVYSLFLAPGLNLFLPMIMFLALFLAYHAWRRDHFDNQLSIRPTIIGLVALCAINIIFMVDIELTLRHNRPSDESAWTFGQILAMLLLVLPIRDVIEATIARIRTASIRDALRDELPIEKLLHLATLPGADINTRITASKYQTLLHLAVARGDEMLVAVLLRLGADPNVGVDYLFRTAEAWDGGPHMPILRLLIEKGTNAKLDYENFHNIPVLYFMSEKGHLDIVHMLLDKGADPNAAGGRYGSALAVAAYLGHIEVARLLCEHGADPNFLVHKMRTALQLAAYRGHTETVLMLLDQGADLNISNEYYGTALQTASGSGHTLAVKILLEKGADPNIQGGDYYRTALHRASEAGHIEIVRLLLAHGADANIAGCGYERPLETASSQGHREIVRLLLHSGADPNIRSERGKSALQRAAIMGHVDVVELLLDEGADPNLPSGYYGTALHAAADKGRTDIVRLLLDRGADPNIQSDVLSF